MSAWIAVDGGQSQVRVGHSGAATTVLTGPGYVHGPGVVERIVAAIAEAVVASPAPSGAVVGVGHTGFPSDPESRVKLGSALLELFDAAEVRCAPDWVTAHLGALSGRPGIVLAVGTGAVCLGASSTGSNVAVGGWGPVFGDAGSAFWIGRAGIEAALRHEDGRTKAPALHTATRRAFGSDLHVATDELYAAPDLVDRVARLAPSVLRAAEDRDPAAQGIVRRAVDAYVEMVRAAADQLPAEAGPAVSYAGGVLTQAPALVSMLRSELARQVPDAVLTAPVGDALRGAELLATTEPRLFDDLVTRTPRSES